MRLFNFVFCLTVIVVLYFNSLELKGNKSENQINENVGIIESVTDMIDGELSDVDTIIEYEDEIFRVMSNFSELFEELDSDLLESLDNELFGYLDVEIEE